MNCQEFNSLAPTLAESRLLEARLKSDALEHSAKCSLCAARLTAERGVTHALRVAAEAERETAPAHVKTALLQAFAAQTASRSASNVVAFPAPARRFRRWAVAAALLLSAALPAALLWRYNQTATTPAPVAKKDEPVTPAEKTETPVAPGPSATETTPVAAAPIIRRNTGVKPQIVKVRHASRPRLVAPTRPGRGLSIVRETTPEAATDTATDTYKGFIALTYNQFDASEGGLVVRVNVPRSTLTAMGLPANAGGSGSGSEQVKADLLVGDDGVAKAIRFVADTGAAPKFRR